MKNIVIVGIGSLGKHHLDSILELQEEKRVFAIESDSERVLELRSIYNISKEVIILAEVSEIKDYDVVEIDLSIIATTSGVRRTVFEELVNCCSVKNVIFEKVLFTKIEDYYLVKNIIEKNKINAYVNCARREIDFYQNLKEMTKGKRLYVFDCIGGAWGLGCNAVHMLDLIQYLTGSEIDSLDISKLKNELVESKRKGYKEFFGTITGECGQGAIYNITCIKNSSLPTKITLTYSDLRVEICESENNMCIYREENNWKREKQSLLIPYQSKMTSKVADRIFKTGSCNLVSYEEAYKEHLKFVIPLMNFFKRNGEESGACPIT